MWCQVERLLDGVDAAIYILDYTKLKTKEEAELLQKLKVRPLRPPCSTKLACLQMCHATTSSRLHGHC